MMLPAEGTHLLFIDDQGVLFHEPAQKLYHLNTTATFIWCQLEEGMDDDGIASELQSVFNLSASQAEEYLRSTESLLQSFSVLKGFEDDPADKGEPDIAIADSRNSKPLDKSKYEFTEVRTLALLDSTFRIRFGNPEHAVWIDPILGHLMHDSVQNPATSIDVVNAEDGSILIYCNGKAVLECREPNELGPLIKHQVWYTAVKEHEFTLDIHAAVVGDGSHCYLFPAAPGSGKSTLSLSLAHHGFEFFSDEVALLHGNEYKVCPVPLAACVKDTGLEPLAEMFPDIRTIRPHMRGDGKIVRYLDPTVFNVPAVGTRRPVGAIFFPQYTPDSPTSISKVSSLEALLQLMRECLVVNTRLDLDKIISLLQWIEETPCYRLEVSDLDRARERIKSVI